MEAGEAVSGRLPACESFQMQSRCTPRVEASYGALLVRPKTNALFNRGLARVKTSPDCSRSLHDNFEYSKFSLMNLTDTVQDYLKTIYSIARAGERVGTTAIADRLNISPASVTSMVKRLSSMGYVTYHRYHGVELTDQGTAVALEVIRHHRLLEAYLHQSLGLSWDRVHDEAEVLEHALSEELEDTIARILGNPTHDPHGDPIPPKGGTYKEVLHESLESALPGPARVERVSDRDPEVLRHLARLGLQPGAEIVIERKDPYGGPVWVKVGKRRHAIGSQITNKVFVSRGRA